MLDSLELFEEIGQNEFLENTEFILFLNKHDLFVEKLKTSKLTSCFPDYEGKGKSFFFFLKVLTHVFDQNFCINSAFVFCAFELAQTPNSADAYAEDRYRYGCNR